MVNDSVRFSVQVFRAPWKLLTRYYKVTAPVLLPARLDALHAKRLFLAEADRAHPVGANALRNQELFHRRRTPVAQRQVVFRRAALVAVALDDHLDRRIVLQEVRRL